MDSDHDDQLSLADALEQETCYILQPSSDERPAKRQRSGKPGHRTNDVADKDVAEAVAAPWTIFPTLLEGREADEARELRFNTFEKLWAGAEGRLNDALEKINEDTLGSVSAFAETATPEMYKEKIPTALIFTGPNIASHGALFGQISSRISEQNGIGPVVVLTSKDCVNLKGTLKKLIHDATAEEDDEGEEADRDDDLIISGTGGSKRRYLNYDLQILCDWCNSHPTKKVIVAVQDTEAFDTGVLADVIELFYKFLDRIPFVLLLGIATDEELFYDKLPQSAISRMRGEGFQVAPFEASMEQVFDAAVNSPDILLRMGPSLCDFIFERQRDYSRSVQAFVSALKYAYMSHFYANPLTVVLGSVDDKARMAKVLSDDHVEAIRNLTSFQHHVEDLLEKKNLDQVSQLLNDDDYLREYVFASIKNAGDYTQGIARGLALFDTVKSCLSASFQRNVVKYELYAQILSGEFVESTLVREAVLAVKKMNSGSLLNVLNKILAEVDTIPELDGKIRSWVEQISSLQAEKWKETEEEESKKKSGRSREVKASGGSSRGGALVSEFSISTDTMRTTVISGKIKLEELKKDLKKQDAEYSKIVQEFVEDLKAYFDEKLKGVHGIFLNEVLFYDLRSPHRDVFAARSRAAVERALSRPQDYLACKCCVVGDEEGEAEGPIPTNPATSILYQLYLEAGSAQINIYDLWRAFLSILSTDEEEYPTETAQALFFKGIAELRFMGFVRHNKSKKDYLEKLAWKGL